MERKSLQITNPFIKWDSERNVVRTRFFLLYIPPSVPLRPPPPPPDYIEERTEKLINRSSPSRKRGISDWEDGNSPWGAKQSRILILRRWRSSSWPLRNPLTSARTLVRARCPSRSNPCNIYHTSHVSASSRLAIRIYYYTIIFFTIELISLFALIN